MLAIVLRTLSPLRSSAGPIFGIVLFLLSQTSPCHAQAPGLVAAYSFNEGSGTTVTDVSGNHITGTIVGATWTTGGMYGNALSFNGSGSYVDLGNPAALQMTGSMTLEAWVKAAANPPDDGQIIAKSNGTGWQLKTSPDTGPHTFGVQVSASQNSNAQRYSTTVRALNTWYHVAAVYDTAADTLEIYVNGILNSGTLRGTIPALQVDGGVNVNIGRRTDGYYFNGVIDEVRVYNRALSQAEIQTDMNTPLGDTPPPPDTTPPTVSVSSPADGATVSGTTTVLATAADNVGVADVQFTLDGAPLGNQIANPPYALQWNTGTTALGTHVLAATATDFGGNTATSTGISVNVVSPSPQQIGQWSAVMTWPIVAVHAMLLPTGNVLGWTDYTTNQGAQIWRPATNTFTPKTYDTVSLFCSGHAYMADGRLMIAGGIVGLTDDLGPQNGTIFDPVTETWSQGALMKVGRYYPTTTTLPDGRILVQGGTTTCVSCVADIPEIYDPVANFWTPLAQSARMAFQYYPHVFVLPDGRIIVAGEDDRAISTRVLDLNTQTWTTIDPRILDGHSSAMYQPGKIIKAGTATADNPGLPSAPTTYVLDMTQSSPAWQQTASMAFPRSFLNLTVLPDGQVLATGGGTTTDPANFAVAVYEAELWSPISKTWSTMARSKTPRLYHSTALLMPDATVLVAGGGRQNGRSQPDPADQLNAEIFSPPYLFKGPRPVISSAPSVIAYNQAFSVASPDASRIGSVSLIALGAVTHAFNQNQRFVPLAFEVVGGSLNVHAPVDGNTAPPGPYMLFLVDTTGVPSVAAMVRLPAPSEDSQPPTPPSNLSATPAIGSVSLTWSGSTDNVAVAGYTVYRSTTSGFTPTAANKIGQATSTTYTDTNLSAAGTYYYVVTAQDRVGNTSGPSNQASAIVTLDTTAPSVSMTGPVAGSQLSGIAAITASASDNVAMAGVQFLLDGANLGAEVLGAGPTYTFNLNTTTAANGPHTLSARARDGAGNIALATGVGVTVSNTVPSGLVAAYSFSEGSGTTVSDGSGNNITGTIVGASWTTSGKYGSALSFNGTSNYIDLGNPAALQLTGSMTLEAWVNAAANPPDDGQIIAKSDGIGWELKTSPDTGPHTFGLGLSGTSSSKTQRYTTTVRALNTWYHIAGVYDATAVTMSTYVNGVLDNGTLRGTIPTSQFNRALNVNIGRRTSGFYFNGIIDEVRVYNRALSQAEIQVDMNTPIQGSNAPTLSSVSPTTGPVAGGTSFTITGSNFVSGATVTFGGAAATNVVVTNSTTITATAPAHAAGAVTVTVTNPDTQSGSLSGGFTYTSLPAPSMSSASPNSGPATGGTAVTITGTNFVSGATVTFGGTAATNVVVTNSATITATTPSHAAGAVTVKVTNPDTQNSSLTTGFTYVAAPAVTSITPNNGAIAGGTAVTIAGTNFVSGATVAFGGTAATNVVVANSTTITATTPANAAGAVTLTVTNPDGQSGNLTNGFTYLAPPTVVSVSPNTGSTGGGTAVTITGTNFTTGATVRFGTSVATNVTVVNATTITASTPAGSAGVVTVTVTINGQSGSLTNAFTYVIAPSVSSVLPSSGPIAGGTAVTITGTNFAAGASVTFGGTAATNVVLVSSTSITATAPAHAAGAVTVTVTVNSQSGSLSNGFTYNAPVAIGFAQVAAATPQPPTQVVTVKYPGAQTAHDLNVVVVGWNDATSTVQSVKDSAGNIYSLAIGPTSGTGLRQSIYYAANIVGGSNTVTVTFNQAAASPDIRILEYKGLSTLDVTAGTSGNSATASSGAATTTAANELIFGANTVATSSRVGSGFTSRIITSPDGDLAEDKVVTAIGSNSATAPLNSSGPWVMQMVTFK
jgi:Concanavalin A-like lectin/glucanases superfamily/Domain of unknown function (DUF1929)/IPT/TIG domain/Bacterial Ig domain